MNRIGNVPFSPMNYANYVKSQSDKSLAHFMQVTLQSDEFLLSVFTVFVGVISCFWCGRQN